MNFRLRRVDVSDHLVQALIATMHEDCFPGDARYTPKVGHWWLALHGTTEAAFLGVVPAVQPGTVGDGYLERVGVLPKFQGHRLQAQLTLRALAYLRRHSTWPTIVSDCRAYNVASANSFIRCGFKTFTPSHPWGFADAIYWYRKT